MIYDLDLTIKPSDDIILEIVASHPYSYACKSVSKALNTNDQDYTGLIFEEKKLKLTDYSLFQRNL